MSMFRRIIGFIDWRFLIALCLLIGMGAGVRGSLAAGEERDTAIAGWAADRKIWEEERDRASIERNKLLQGQEDLTDKYDRLVRWLNDQNIAVPPEVLNGRTTIRVESDDGDSDDSDESGDSNSRSPITPTPSTSRPPATGGGGGSDDGGSKSGP